MRYLLIIAILLTSASTTLAATYYKWVDDQGVTHYDVKPPEEGDAQSIRTYRSASSDQGAALERLEQDRASRATPKATGSSEPVSEETRTACDQQRKNLETLTQRPVVRRENPRTGEMDVLDQEERAALLEQTRAAIAFCESQGG